jgi:hypothetical protein
LALGAEELVHVADTLFLRRGCLQCGYTKLVLEHLQKPRVLYVRGGTSKVLGGAGRVGAELVTRCLQRMAGWVQLLVKSLDAEFPEWQLIQAFRVFRFGNAPDAGGRRVNVSRHALGPAVAADRERCLARLAKAFRVDPGTLGEEYPMTGNGFKALTNMARHSCIHS